MPEKLKPCPICGSTEILRIIYGCDDKHMSCANCHHRTSQKRSTWKLAEILWNREAVQCPKN